MKITIKYLFENIVIFAVRWNGVFGVLVLGGTASEFGRLVFVQTEIKRYEAIVLDSGVPQE